MKLISPNPQYYDDATAKLTSSQLHDLCRLPADLWQALLFLLHQESLPGLHHHLRNRCPYLRHGTDIERLHRGSSLCRPGQRRYQCRIHNVGFNCSSGDPRRPTPIVYAHTDTHHQNPRSVPATREAAPLRQLVQRHVRHRLHDGALAGRRLCHQLDVAVVFLYQSPDRRMCRSGDIVLFPPPAPTAARRTDAEHHYPASEIGTDGPPRHGAPDPGHCVPPARAAVGRLCVRVGERAGDCVFGGLSCSLGRVCGDPGDEAGWGHCAP